MTCYKPSTVLLYIGFLHYTNLYNSVDIFELGWLSVGSFLCGNLIAESIYSFACNKKEYVINRQNLLCNARIKVFSAFHHIWSTQYSAVVDTLKQLTTPTLKQLTSPTQTPLLAIADAIAVQLYRLHCRVQYFRLVDQFRTCVVQ